MNVSLLLLCITFVTHRPTDGREILEVELDLESIMSSLRMDFEKEGISFGIDWDLKILN